MVKISKREALETCRRLWLWMAQEKKRSDLDKKEWPEWKNNGGKVKPMLNKCPCCEYQEQHYDHSLGCGSTCLLSSLWSESYTQPCTQPGSPYFSFFDDCGTPEDAMKIVKACEKELANL